MKYYVYLTGLVGETNRIVVGDGAAHAIEHAIDQGGSKTVRVEASVSGGSEKITFVNVAHVIAIRPTD